MTTILPAERSPWSVIGKQIGANLSQNLPGAVQQGFQRQLGLNSIDQLQSELMAAGNDPTKQITALMRAHVLNPQMERSGLSTALLNQIMSGQFPGALGTGAGNTPVSNVPQGNMDPNLPQQQIPTLATTAMEDQQPQPATVGEGKKTAQDINTLGNQYLAEFRPDLINPATQYGAINTFTGINKQDLTPEEESQLRQQLIDKGYKNADLVNSVVNRVREGIKNKYNEALSQYGFNQDRLNQINKKWNDFTAGTSQRLAPHLQKYGNTFPRTNEILQNKYNQYAGNLPTDFTPEQMHTNAMELLQNDINKIDALHAIPSMAPTHSEKGVKDYIEGIKKPYKDLDDMGFREALREDALLNKDMGNEEFHASLWGDQTNKNLLNDLHKKKAPQEYTQVMPGTLKYNPKYEPEKRKYIDEISNSLKSLSPNDDLILARAMVLDNGGTVKDFTDALSLAQQKGLKLSEFQKSQLQEINIPRRPPLWEIFSKAEPSPVGSLFSPVFGNLNWKPFINYLRGKK